MADPYVLVDSSIWVLCYRRGTPTEVAARVRELLVERRVATVGPVVLEVLGGARDENEYEQMREEFEAYHWCELSAATWQIAARDAYELRLKGITVPLTEVVIARVARDNGYTLLHRDRHFELIGRQIGLQTKTV